MPKEQSGTMLKKLFACGGHDGCWCRRLPAWRRTRPVVIEEVVARVNNEVITRGDLEHARSQLRQEAQQDCPNCTPDEINEKVADGEKNLLRDLIDNSLLVQRGKDMGIKRRCRRGQAAGRDPHAKQHCLDGRSRGADRQERHLDFEDFKNNIKNQLLQQEVIRREVGSKIILDHEEVQKYYEDHKDEFVRPEQVILREIFVSTEGKPDADIPALQKKAEDLLAAGEERRGFRRTGQAFLRRQHGQARRRPGHIRARPAGSQYRTGGF